ncbi:hypothetical protein P4N68_12630 [Corynebacterium felinum]|uniref:Secreted protein n=1 Tax=Corynebacterium felinum TaxID=131318 RepID=A0ABU2BAZ6_9CORY|nr:hypothetical protein [Corynebacterium felinum]MDF5821913.1 hypothetical protein [Corynebacterium felinum]MDR7355797.1 hypothetical protein [Corynebacterium felinum]WJY95143.1 hypothetical protein CFELI_07645 [Corynebacterium felinum]
MKITRKAIVSLAAAAAISTGAFTPVMAQDTSDSLAQEIQKCKEKFPDTTKTDYKNCVEKAENDRLTSTEKLRQGSKDDKGNVSPKKIGEWIAIIGTVITVLTSLLGFFAKLPNMFKA